MAEGEPTLTWISHKLVLFFLLRYLLLAAALYYVGAWYSKPPGVAFLLVTLLPAGVSSPGFVGLYRSFSDEVSSLVVMANMSLVLMISLMKIILYRIE